jgi:hypothetical protein
MKTFRTGGCDDFAFAAPTPSPRNAPGLAGQAVRAVRSPPEAGPSGRVTPAARPAGPASSGLGGRLSGCAVFQLTPGPNASPGRGAATWASSGAAHPKGWLSCISQHRCPSFFSGSVVVGWAKTVRSKNRRRRPAGDAFAEGNHGSEGLTRAEFRVPASGQPGPE